MYQLPLRGRARPRFPHLRDKSAYLKPTAAALAGLAAFFASAAFADGAKAGGLSVQHPWARETAAGQAAGGGFMAIANTGSRGDQLVSGTSPVAAEVQLHSMTMDGGVMRMRRLTAGLAIPAGTTVELRPGGLHLMFIGLKRPLREGERFPVTLRFQRAGRVTVQFAVRPVGAGGPMEAGHAGH